MEYLIIIMIVVALYFIIPSKNDICSDEWDGSDIDGGMYGIEDNIYPYEVKKKKTNKRTRKTKTQVKSKVKAKRTPKKRVKGKTKR